MSTLYMAASSGRLLFEDWENDTVVKGKWEIEEETMGNPNQTSKLATCFHVKLEAFPSKRQGLTQGLLFTMIP